MRTGRPGARRAGGRRAPETGLSERGFLIFQTRERAGSTQRMASRSVSNSVSVAAKPTPCGLSGPSGMLSQFTCKACVAPGHSRGPCSARRGGQCWHSALKNLHSSCCLDL